MPLTKLKLALLTLAIPLAALAAEPSTTSAESSESFDHSEHSQNSASQRHFGPLISKVRKATWKYRDIKNAYYDQFEQATPCVSGPNSGAMGVHFLSKKRLGDGVLKAEEPEALIYEPQPDGDWRFVGVEYIILKADWETLHPDPAEGPPEVDGNSTHLVTDPNRYRLPAFYELHIWAWEQNPNGNYADFNSRVTCEKQPLPVL